MKFAALLATALFAGTTYAKAIVSTDSTPLTPDQIPIPVTTANSRGAADITPKLIVTQIIDKVSSKLSSSTLAGMKRHRRRENAKRALPALRWPYNDASRKVR